MDDDSILARISLREGCYATSYYCCYTGVTMKQVMLNVMVTAKIVMMSKLLRIYQRPPLLSLFTEKLMSAVHANRDRPASVHG